MNMHMLMSDAYELFYFHRASSTCIWPTTLSTNTMRTLSETRQWTKGARGQSAGSPSSSAPTTTMWPSSGETSLYVGCPPKRTQTQLHADILGRMYASTKARMITKRSTNANNTNLLMYSHIYTFSYYQPTHAAHKTQTYQQRLDMICNDSNSVSFRALFNSRKSSVKTSFLEGELYLALLSAHPNTFTLFLFFHQSLLGRFFYLLYLINFHPSHYMPNHSYSFLFYPFLSSGSVYALLYFILYLYFFFTLAFCPSVRSHLGCMVPEYLYCLFSCYQHSTSQSNPIGYCTFLKAVFYLFFHFSLFILNKVAFETIVAAEESLYYIYYLHIYLLQQIRI